ncbi:MAG: hypothetical protein EZS28_023191 [Streblomastix strix]|uniref:Uncharacterized protein n=1 Tax=Streblomastix strix TaxID=222440 RepID=A0A5J4VFQ3_9EUKA|nr:MAG: hypothetical protein EZS28_023191 [Streblomastix strix]
MSARSRYRLRNQRRNQPPQSQPPLNRAKSNKNRPSQQQLQLMRNLVQQIQRNQQQNRQAKNSPTKPHAKSPSVALKETVAIYSRKQRRKLKSESRKQRNKKRKQRKSAKKQEKRQIRDQMNRENYLSWIQHYGQSLYKNSREILRKNQVEIQDLIDKYGDFVLLQVSSGDPEIMTLSKPLNLDLLRQAINEARTGHS